jgi:hypothetical protein
MRTSHGGAATFRRPRRATTAPPPDAVTVDEAIADAPHVDREALAAAGELVARPARVGVERARAAESATPAVPLLACMKEDGLSMGVGRRGDQSLLLQDRVWSSRSSASSVANASGENWRAA